MRRWVPAPLLSVGLLVVWVVLEGSVDVATILLGVLIAWAVPILVAPLRPLPVRVRHPLTVVRLVTAVAVDALRSNVDVARRLVEPRSNKRVASFVTIPLELRDANGLAALAVITTFVPGTVWCELALDRSALRLHVFDLDDEARFVAHYKARYEQPLMEIFQT